MRRIRMEVADLEWRMERYRAELVTCRWCGALGREDLPPNPDGSESDGQHCTNGRTGDEINAPACPPRIADALEKEAKQ